MILPLSIIETFTPRIGQVSNYMGYILKSSCGDSRLWLQMTNFTMQFDGTHPRRLISVSFLKIVPNVKFSNKLY